MALDPLTQAMWNWATYHRRSGGQAKTREDWLATWGDLGGAMYDWGKTMYDQNLGDSVTEDAFQMQINNLGATSPIGGAVGKFYAPPTTQDQEPTAQQDFGMAADEMFRLIGNHVNVYGGMTREALSNSWGDLGGAVYDWLRGQGILDSRSMLVQSLPDPARFKEIVSYMAYTYKPGGSQGFPFSLAPNAQQKQQDWLNAYNQKVFEAEEANRQAQLALQQGNQALAQQQFGLAQKAQADANALAYAQMAQQGQQFGAQLAQQGQQFNVGASGYIDGQKTLDRQRIEADIQATNERIRIAEQQGNAQLALDERKRIDALQIALGQLGQQEAGITGYYGGQPTFAREQYSTELKANPRDWVKAWTYQRGQNPNTPMVVPPWLQNVYQNKPSAGFQASSGGLGDFPIKAPDPNQINAKTWNTLAPSEQEGLLGLASSSGWWAPDYIKQLQNSWTKQNVRPADMWAGGY